MPKAFTTYRDRPREVIPISRLLSRQRPLVKICGLTRAEEALYCAEAGADMCGFVFHPRSPRYIEPRAAGKIPTPGAARVGVFVCQGPEEILRIMEEAGLDLAQLHGEQGHQAARAVGRDRAIKVFWPERFREEPSELVGLMASWADLSSLFLLDSGLSGGGHGREQSSGPLAQGLASPRPFLMAGGLALSSLARFWPSHNPALAGLDFNSGVEISPGRKDPEAVRGCLAALGKRRPGPAGRPAQTAG